MYESPIKIIEDQLHNQIITDMENEIMKALMRYQIHIDKEELLKALKYDREQYEKGYQDGLNADKWISCSERLPEIESEEYLMCTTTGLITRCVWTKAGWNTCKEIDGTYYTECKLSNVIAWQPLPEPYKENADD